MSVNDDFIQPTSDSFWEVDCYKRTVKRHHDGHVLSSDLMQLIQERAEIEKSYAKSLRQWANKWTTHIEKGPEYGTMEAAWKGVLREAESVADLHIRVKDQLMMDVHNSVKQWRSENYTKPMVGPIKQTKDLEDGFKKAQKPWAKRLAKVNKAKKEYHTACKLEKSAINQESNAKNDSAVSPDQMKKLQDKVEKCRQDVESTKGRFEGALNEINSYNAKYMEEMAEVFNKSQDMEERRLKFFKEMLFGIQKCLNLSETNEYTQTYSTLWATVNNADYSKDLKWWSQNHGVDMPMNWPTFEEYSPELHAINRSKKGGGLSGPTTGDGIMLTSMKTDTSLQSTAVPSMPPPASVPEPQHSYDNSLMANSTNSQSNGGPQQNPFGDDDFEGEYDRFDDAKGVPVRALYDYVGQEEDEITFKTGDVFEKLMNADGQGWCTGRKDGKVGLYPNNYVESVDN